MGENGPILLASVGGTFPATSGRGVQLNLAALQFSRYHSGMIHGKVYYKKCRRFNAIGHAHELTFSCYKNQPFLASERTCQWLVESVDQARKKYGFSMWAYVFMPEYVHLLICPMNSEYSISKILQPIKQPVAQRAVAYLRRNNPADLDKLATGQRHQVYRLWQAGGGYDRNISKTETITNAARYIHHNPVRRGLTDTPENWYYCSTSAWQGSGGPLEIDFHSYPVY